MKRRILSAFFAVVFAAASVLLSTVSYAAPANGIEVSSASLSPGDAFYITLSVPPTDNADTVSVKVEFDSSAFEVKSWAPQLANSVYNSGDGFFIVTSANADRVIDLSGGLVLRADMAVKPTALSGNYAFILRESSFSYVADNGYEFIELWRPGTTQATVVVGNQSGSGNVNNPSSGSQINTNTNTNNSTNTNTNTNGSGTSSGSNTQTTDQTSSAGSVEEIQSGDDEETMVETDDSDDSDSESVDEDGTSPAYDDDDDGESGSQSSGGNNSSGKSAVTLSSVLDGVSASSRVRVSTLSSYFDNDTEIRLSNTAEADQNAARALDNLGLRNRTSYAFDISLFDKVTNSYVHTMPRGYIDFTVPVPEKLAPAGKSLSLYHIESGYPTLMESSVITEDGQTFIWFRANTFSPFMIVDASETASGTSQNNTSSGGTSQQTSTNQTNNGSGQSTASDTKGAPVGISNPHTGVTAAVLIPTALVGCAVLSRKTAQKRKRTKKYIEP